MSTVESASMPGTEVSEKNPVDFGAKTVSLKSQSDTSRLLQGGPGQIRNVPTQGNVRSSLGVNTTHTNVPVLSSVSTQKSALTRVSTSTVQSSSTTMGSLTRPVVPATAVSTSSHVTSSYHVPRGTPQVSSMSSRTTVARSSVTLLPVGLSTTTAANINIAPTIRTPSPGVTASRAPSPMQQSSTWGTNASNVITVPRCISPSTTVSRTATIPSRTVVSTSKASTPQQIHRSADTPRPLLLHAAPQKPVTLTQATQLHITTDKTIKVPSVTQVLPLRPPYSTSSGFIGTQGTTILQSAVAPNTVLTTPVRLNVSASSQPPLLSTQRVAVSATQGTVLASRIAVPSASPSAAQAVAVGGAGSRIPGAVSQGTIIATSNRIPGTTTVSQATTVLPQTRLVTGQNTILATSARLGTQLVTAQPAVLTATARVANTGTTVLTTSKPSGQSLQTAIITTNSRMPASCGPNHQPSATRVVTSTVSNNVTRFPTTVSTATRTTSNVTQQLMTVSTTTSRLNTAASQPSGIVVHPQIVVNNTKSVVHGINHMTTARPVHIHSTNTGQKVITQPLHGPIQITQSPVNISTSKSVSQSTSQNTVQTTITTVASKQMCYTPTTSVTTRPVAVVASQSIPITKIFPQNSATPVSAVETDVNTSQGLPPQSSSVYIQATHRTLSSPGLVCTPSSLPSTNAPTLSTYTLPGGASFFYEAPSGYQLATDAPLVARPLSPDTPLVSRQLSSEGPLIARPFTPGIITTSQPMRLNPVMIVDPSVTVQPTYTSESSTLMISESGLTSASKLTSSPRPSILRKRDNEASPAKASKNLTPMLSSASVSRSASPSPPSLHLETNQQSIDHGPSSNGSTTISATSSPGPDDPGDSNMPVIKIECNDDNDRPPVEMSPRKKPRKQLLNDANDAIEMEFISDDRIKKEREEEIQRDKVYVVKRPNISLLHSYKHSWKSRHNHFLRYSDVKPKDERRPTVTDLANQKQVVQKVNGWKVYHLSAQMEDLSEMESHVLERLSTMLQAMDRPSSKELEKDVNRVNDLIMGNIQRSKVIKDQMQEARTQMMKVFDHKVHVSEIISRCASKRNFKKREKY